MTRMTGDAFIPANTPNVIILVKFVQLIHGYRNSLMS